MVAEMSLNHREESEELKPSNIEALDGERYPANGTISSNNGNANGSNSVPGTLRSNEVSRKSVDDKALLHSMPESSASLFHKESGIQDVNGSQVNGPGVHSEYYRRSDVEAQNVDHVDGEDVNGKFEGVSTGALFCGPPLFIVLFIVGLCKAVITVLPTVIVIVVGNTGTVVGLFPWTVWCTYSAVWSTRQLYVGQKISAMALLPLPLCIWPLAVLMCSMIGSLLYGFFKPQWATFKAIQNYSLEDRPLHILKDGVWETWEGAASVVRDFADFHFHSYASYLESFEKKERARKQPLKFRLLLIPGCISVAILGICVDIPLISVLAVLKFLPLLFSGWHTLIRNVLNRGGPVRVGLCLPLAFVAFLAWPCMVLLMLLSAVFFSFVVAIYAAVVAYQENSILSGALYTIAVAAEFDEFSNELIGHGNSCLPRPQYRSSASFRQGSFIFDTERGEFADALPAELSMNSSRTSRSIDRDSIQASSRGSRTGDILRHLTDGTIVSNGEELRTLQTWKSLFHHTRQQGEELCDKGMLSESDLEQWVAAKRTTGSTIAGAGLVGLCLVRTVQKSHKQLSEGLMLVDGTTIESRNHPRSSFFDWFLEPLLELKEQLRYADLTSNEERYLEAWVIAADDSRRFQRWLDGIEDPPDNARKMGIQSFGRRIQGMAVSMTRFPTFRRRHQAVIQHLLEYTRAESVDLMMRSKSAPNLLM